jgi:oligopeptide transport system ATP-binding protein
MRDPLVEVKDLRKYYPVMKGLVLSRKMADIKAVDGVTFSIEKGETFGLVGESGCGKTTISRLMLRLQDLTSGSILYGKKNISRLTPKESREYCSRVQAVFQDPYSSLSPRMKVGEIIGEPIVTTGKLPNQEVRQRVQELLHMVRLTSQSAELYPHEFSGGQRQRIAIARAIAVSPDLLILDEPVSALDVSIQAQIMNLLKELQEKFGFTYFLIAHDLAVVKHMSNRVAVMYLGRLVEVADSDELYRNPLHPYTRALLSAALPMDPDGRHEPIILQGEVPSPLRPPPGCSFHPRCNEAKPGCDQMEPVLRDAGGHHLVACFD